MSRPSDGTLARALKFAVAIVIPIAGFLLSSRRELRIGAAFLAHELTGLASLAGLMLLALPFLAAVVLWRIRERHGSSLFAITISHALPRSRALLLLVGTVSVGMTAVHLGTRYRRFSEASFQREAMQLVDAGDYRRAHAVCRRYLTLYPQRRETGAFPDPICNPVLEFTGRIPELRAFVSRQSPTPLVVDRMVIPVEPDARERTLEILDAWSRP